MTFGARVAAAVAQIRFRGVVPLVLMSTLILAVGAYTAVRQDAFLSSYNLNNLLLATMPLALVSMGQTCALLVGGFDVSVGALMTLCVVVASYTMTPTTSQLGLIPGALALVGVGLATGVFNAVLIRVFRLPSIIATLATFSILEGAALLLARPSRGIDQPRRRRRAHDQLELRAARLHRGRRPRPARRRLALPHAHGPGVPRSRARRDGVAPARDGDEPHGDPRLRRLLGDGLDRRVLPGAQVQIGSPIIGNQALESIAAAVLGGASLAGGRGSFVGALLAALFLSLIDNILPLFQAPTEYAEMTIGILILVALILYQTPELLARLRSSWGGVGRLRAGRGDAPAG